MCLSRNQLIARFRSASFQAWTAVAIAAALILGDGLTRSPGEALTREHGGIETASALLYFAAALVWVLNHSAVAFARSWQLPAVLVMMAGRELELDKSLTSVGLLKSNLYLADQTPLWERFLGLAVLAFLVVVVLRLVRFNRPGFLRGLRRGAPAALAVVAAIGTAVFAKTIDGLGRKLEPFGLVLDRSVADRFGAFEEAFELLVPALLLFAVVHSLGRAPS